MESYKTLDQPDEPAMTLKQGKVLGGKYELREQLGRGGMGVVWSAEDRTAGRSVVLKFVPSELKNFESAVDQVRDSFRKVHALQHQHICPMYALEYHDSLGYYLVMKRLDGETLDRYVVQTVGHHQPMPLDEVVRILLPVAKALDYAHGEKIVHRDIKPSNIFIELDAERGFRSVQLIDFGIASEIRSTLTRVTQMRFDVSGTLPYMSPEQARGRAQTGKTDQYALGIVAYELLSGNVPFQNEDKDFLRSAILNETPEKIADLPESINAALLKVLAKDGEKRFENCEAFIRALKADQDSDDLSDEWKEELGGYVATFDNVFEAAKFGTVKDVRYFVEQKGVDINKVDDEHGGKPFFLAAACNSNVAVLKYFVSLGADVNDISRDGTPPLVWAAHNNPNIDVLKYLISQGADVNKRYIGGNGCDTTAVLGAAMKNLNVNVLKCLVTHGADINVKNFNGQTPLHVAVMGSIVGIEVIKYLLSLGLDVNAQDDDGGTPLHYAAGLNHKIEVLNYLLDQGANVNIKANNGVTPLDIANTEDKKAILRQPRRDPSLAASHYQSTYADIFHAAALGSVDDVRYFVETMRVSVNAKTDREGAVPGLKIKDMTPLHMAATQNTDVEVCEYLIVQGADVNAKAVAFPFKYSPLYYAMKENPNTAVMRCLIAHGADVNEKMGYPVSTMIEFAPNAEKRQILREAGGKKPFLGGFFG